MTLCSSLDGQKVGVSADSGGVIVPLIFFDSDEGFRWNSGCVAEENAPRGMEKENGVTGGEMRYRAPKEPCRKLGYSEFDAK